MIRAVALFADRQRAAHQRLGLGEAVRVLKQQREIVEADRHVGMIGAVALFVDLERAAHQWFGLGEAVRVLKQRRKIVEADRHIRMIRAVAFLVDRQRAAHRRLGLGVGRLGLEQNCKPVEQPRGGLGNLRCVRRARDRESVRREWIENWPASYILGLADEGRIDPFQGFA